MPESTACDGFDTENACDAADDGTCDDINTNYDTVVNDIVMTLQ